MVRFSCGLENVEDIIAEFGELLLRIHIIVQER